jgi:molybdate transport system substrate-binding protein
MRPWLLRTLFIGSAFSFALIASGQAAEIKVLSGSGAKAAVAELGKQFERASGHKVAIAFAVNPQVRRRIESGEAFDVAILNPPVLDALIKQGKVLGDTRTVIGRAGIGMAVRQGAPKPDISSVEAFKRTLLGAGSVSYPGEGASGKYFAGLIDRLGIGAEMKPKMRPMSAEDNVEAVARGEVEMVAVVASHITGVPGVEFVGLIPQELQTWIGFTAGVGRDAKEPEAARALLRFFASPAAASILKAAGVEPFAE